LINAFTELAAEQEVKRIEILTLENEIYNLKKSCRSIEKQKQEELKSLEQVLQEQYDILIRRLERSRRRTNV
jgi:predicted transcriptional regulator